MSLFKQIALLVSLAFILLASVIVLNDYKRSALFFQGQLQTTAQDMATTLGIAIGNLPVADDLTTLEVLFNSVFDSGYYSRIALIRPNGVVMLEKSRDIALDRVPDWFMRALPLIPAQGSTQVMQGWTPLGELRLEMHPGYLYSALYSNLVQASIWFVVLLIASIATLWLLLHVLLRPLKRVREQAEAIQNNQFVEQSQLPRTQELRQMVEAMNRMVVKLQQNFADQTQNLERYQQLLYRDSLSGLGNRNYLLEQLQLAMDEPSSLHGCLVVIRMQNFEQLRDQHGYEIGDQLVLALAGLISEQYQGTGAQVTARLSDDEYALLLTLDEESTIHWISQVFQRFQQKTENLPATDNLYLAAGIAPLETSQNIGELLAGIDYCLSKAVNKGAYCIETSVTTQLALPSGKMQWRSWLEDIIESRKLFLAGQEVLNSKAEAVQCELFIRARNEAGQVIPASAFMPMASTLGMALEIDKTVFSLVRESHGFGRDVPLAVNLSAAFFEMADAQEEFDQLLSSCHAQGQQLCIEASHHILLQHAVMRAQVADRVKRNGHQFGIDNLDLSQPLQLLQSGEFDYVKINAKTLHEIGKNNLSAGYQSLKAITDSLDIRIIAVAVDSQSLYDELQQLGIEVMQGHHLRQPEEL